MNENAHPLQLFYYYRRVNHRFSVFPARSNPTMVFVGRQAGTKRTVRDEGAAAAAAAAAAASC